MRRKDREITDIGEIRQILERAKILHLGLNDEGCPYVVPLHYGYRMEDGRLTLFCHGAKEGHKLDLIRKDPRAFVEIDTDVQLIPAGDRACAYGSAYASLMGRGEAAILTEPKEKTEALRILMKSQTGRDFEITGSMAETVSVLRIDLHEYTAKARKLPG